MVYKIKELQEHFCNKVLKCAQRLQLTENNESHRLPPVEYSSELFGEELLSCIEHLPAAQVCDLVIVFESQQDYTRILTYMSVFSCIENCKYSIYYSNTLTCALGFNAINNNYGTWYSF